MGADSPIPYAPTRRAIRFYWARKRPIKFRLSEKARRLAREMRKEKAAHE